MNVFWLQNELDVRNLSQSEFSKSSGISQSQVSYILKGRPPGRDTLIKMSKTLGYSTDYILQQMDLMPRRNEVTVVSDKPISPAHMRLINQLISAI